MRAAATALMLLACPTAHALDVQVEPRFGNEPLAFDSMAYAIESGQRVSVTRLDFLLSDFAVLRDGAWRECPGLFAFVSAREGRVRFSLDGASGERIRFHVGVPPDVNHADPAPWPAGHPLNPLVNGLHWNWMGGYVFFAIEGRWAGGQGYSYHIATDDLLGAVELELPAGESVALVLNVDRILPTAFTDENSSTHSRSNDVVAVETKARIEHAFALEPRSGATRAEPQQSDTARTPHRFSFPAYFPQPDLPRDNPLTEEGIELGRRLFHDVRLSVNNSQSCASCHQVESAFADPRAVSLGAEGHAGERNAMPIFNLAWRSSFFWDGRSPSLREQARGPIENPVEMHETVTNVASKLAATGEYPGLTADGILLALEQFMLSIVSGDSKFDRSLRGAAELSAEEKRGLELFNTEFDPRRGQLGADCFHCHGGPLFQSQAFANNGLDAEFKDEGRSKVTGREGDRGKFAVPSLRNVALTAPYMHDGRFATLEEVVDHYATGIQPSATLDPNIAKHPLGGVPLSASDRAAIVAFLKTLTDPRFAAPGKFQ